MKLSRALPISEWRLSKALLRIQGFLLIFWNMNFATAEPCQAAFVAALERISDPSILSQVRTQSVADFIVSQEFGPGARTCDDFEYTAFADRLEVHANAILLVCREQRRPNQPTRQPCDPQLRLALALIRHTAQMRFSGSSAQINRSRYRQLVSNLGVQVEKAGSTPLMLQFLHAIQEVGPPQSPPEPTATSPTSSNSKPPKSELNRFSPEKSKKGDREKGEKSGNGDRGKSGDGDREKSGDGDKAPDKDERAVSAKGDSRPQQLTQKKDGAPDFDWPPPRPTTRSLVPTEYLPAPGEGVLLKAVADRLQKALLSRGYQELAWFVIPNGFALVTRLEQITEQGVPAAGNSRWSATPSHPIRRFRDYLDAMFTAPQGRFRVIAFLVTDLPIPDSNHVPDRELAQGWLSAGSLAPPRAAASTAWTSDHACIAYIYEFTKSSASSKPTAVATSNLTAMAHLQAAGLLDALRGLL